ncbi:MAG: L-histidine N(alpha)-methyltransferase, partial [Planctomycetales bacterium]|nr:L-histidine N(alpha)-methyltransferase [Planctomycetales bacterium]
MHVDNDFLMDVLNGLDNPQKNIPSKYFYDQRGSELFEQICELDEYYVTRTELEIMRRYVPEMAQQIDSGVMLVEFGSGSSVKTRLLLDELIEPVAYVPVVISGEHIEQVATQLRQAYPGIDILPVCADFTQPFALPTASRRYTHVAVYFPGSTIGNFTPSAARQLLQRIADLVGVGGGLLIGIDLQKERQILEAAYNDRAGVTAEFNRNLLRRINTELQADFDVDQFRHRAVYDPHCARGELYLDSQTEQTA